MGKMSTFNYYGSIKQWYSLFGFDLNGKDSSDNSHYQIVHFFESSYSFMDIMNDIGAFFENQETVFVMIKPDWNTRGDWRFNDLDILWKKIKVSFVLKKMSVMMDMIN